MRSRLDGGTRGILSVRGAGRRLQAPRAAGRCHGQRWGASSQAGDGGGCRPAFHGRAGGGGIPSHSAAPVPVPIERRGSRPAVLPCSPAAAGGACGFRPRRGGFGAGEMQPGDAPRSLRRAEAGPASAACACAASLPPPPAPPPPPPAAGPSSRLWRCRLPGRAAGGAAVSDSRGVMPGCRRGAGPGAARGRGSEVSGRSRGR